MIYDFFFFFKKHTKLILINLKVYIKKYLELFNFNCSKKLIIYIKKKKKKKKKKNLIPFSYI